MSVVDNAVAWAVGIAQDNSHGYDQLNRWGQDYDCSSLIIQAWENAGVRVKSIGNASHTGNMYEAFKRLGFRDVTSSVNLQTGYGLIKGDVLLNVKSHTAMYIGDGKMVNASLNEKGTVTGGKPGDQTGLEICVRAYGNYRNGWDYALRYPIGTPSVAKPQASKPVQPYAGVVTVNSYLQVRTAPSTGASEKTLGCQSMRLPNGLVVAICEESNGFGRLNNVPDAWVCLDYVSR